ncbi:MAG: SAM-dependent methyltransferase [Micromonosporaceae bacterium]|nr:SAM-dependent methyltransferase [Micromonosporaceae bacterium]
MPTGPDRTSKAATAARIYDYYLGGAHNFPADVAAAKQIIALNPATPAIARANRAFLGRAVQFLVDAGVRQFLDIGSGMPTAGNVHQIAQQAAPDSRVVYVDIDPVAVAESLELLEGDPTVTAIQGDARVPGEILGHERVRAMLDFSQPIGLLMCAVLHFIPDDTTARATVSTLAGALAPGSYLVMSHFNMESWDVSPEDEQAGLNVYRQQTATPVGARSAAQVAEFFAGRADIVEPGIVPVPLWRPAEGDPADFTDNPGASAFLGAVGRIHAVRPQPAARV